MTIMAISPVQYEICSRDREGFIDGLISSRSLGIVNLCTIFGDEYQLRVFESPNDFPYFQQYEPVGYHRQGAVLACDEIWIAVKELIVP